MSRNKSYQYLLDTNIISDIVKNPQGKAASKIISAGNAKVCTSIIVTSEIRFGAKKRASKKLTQQLETILSAIEILPFQSPADYKYAKLRSFLEKTGIPIGPNDLLIAAHAISLNLVLVTANEGEFSRVPKLKIENWLN